MVRGIWRQASSLSNSLFKCLKTISSSVGFLFLGLLLLGSMLSLITYAATAPNIKNIQYLDSTISVVDEYGAPVEGSYVVVLELADGGPRKLSEGFTDFTGKYKASFKIPRKPIHVTTWRVDETGNLHPDAEAKESYAPVNLWIIAYKVYEESGRKTVEIGTLTFSADPSEMKHPVDKMEKTITLTKIEPKKKEESKDLVCTSKTTTTTTCQIPTYPYQEEKWEYTTVLKFATWDNIEARYEYFKGSKLRIESKERYFAISACYYSPWSSTGSTTITWDKDRWIDPNGPWLTGRKAYTLRSEFKYYLIRYCPPYQSAVIIEKVYAVDTDQDGDRTVRDENSWNGVLPNWNYYSLISQGECVQYEITSTGYGQYTFSVGVSIVFPQVGISVSLGVCKEVSPPKVSSLYIRAGTWTSGYKVKVVSNDGTYMQTYSNWILPN